MINILILGNPVFAKNLANELEKNDIEYKIYEEINNSIYYDICVTTVDLLEETQEIKNGQTFVFNGLQMSNSKLKKMVRMQISGFLDDYQDASSIMGIIKSKAKTKEICSRLSGKLSVLCA